MFLEALKQEVEIAKKCAIFDGLLPDDCIYILQSGRTRQVKKGDHFFFEGELAKNFYILLSGKVKLTQSTADGQQVIISYRGPGDGFGIIVVLSQMDYPVRAVAVEDCVALSWNRSTFKPLMLDYPQLAINGMEMIAGPFTKLQRRFRELATERVEQRIARAILRLARQFGKREEAGILINIPLTHQDIAEMSGTTIYTVSRTIRKWENEELVANGRLQLTICHPHKLVKIAEDTP